MGRGGTLGEAEAGDQDRGLPPSAFGLNLNSALAATAGHEESRDNAAELPANRSHIRALWM